MSDNIALALENVSYAFGALPVLQDLTLDVGRGEFVAVVGPSGCGKTTLLNVLSGHLPPTAGQVTGEGRRRMVYQQDGLFPWLTARENIRLGLRLLPPGEQKAQTEELLALIRLERFADLYPHQLSGGMRQRVELARALAGHADLLLMDEPFSALDYQTRLRMRRELARLLALHPCTIVLVTHDLEEAAQLADRIIVFSERPAQILREICLPLPRPRDVTHPQVIEAVRQIFDTLGLNDEAAEEPWKPPSR